ncbi:hypothetical protein J4465_02670 [Candidatus Pacearchaeota archaeon]|nr:hypothetical protein [Candidatus Pacearchaeota archaeon]
MSKSNMQKILENRDKNGNKNPFNRGTNPNYGKGRFSYNQQANNIQKKMPSNKASYFKYNPIKDYGLKFNHNHNIFCLEERINF